MHQLHDPAVTVNTTEYPSGYIISHRDYLLEGDNQCQPGTGNDSLVIVSDMYPTKLEFAGKGNNRSRCCLVIDGEQQSTFCNDAVEGFTIPARTEAVIALHRPASVSSLLLFYRTLADGSTTTGV